MKATYQLFMGRDIPNGGYVTDNMWEEFLNRVDTLVDGYTAQDANGRWHGVSEKAKVLTVAEITKDTAKAIASTYKEMFNQFAVGVQVLPDMEFM